MPEDPSLQEAAGRRQRGASSWLVPATCAIGLLHFGQDVLQPVTLAGILSLMVAPLVRAMRRWGLGRATGTIASVALVGCGVLAAAIVVAFQLAAVASDLPKYRAGIEAKIEQVREVTVRPLEKWRSDLGFGLPAAKRDGNRDLDPADSSMPSPPLVPDTAAVPVDLSEKAVPGFLTLLWRGLAEVGIVLILLVFILLEQDALRDRLLHFTGSSELAATLQALSDTANGVSRYFLAQFVVNLCFGVVIALALWFIGIPHAALFGALAGLLRFVPYLGILAAAAMIAAFAAAIDPGWSLMLTSIAVLVAVELLVANAIEPNVYGHSSGLAPVAIIVSALFWSAVWGPVGLILSTPLTLCLVVTGRHVAALEPITIFLGDSPGLTQGQRLYHRALTGDLGDIEEEGRNFLARRSFAAYCDYILFPGIRLAVADYLAGRLQEPQLRAIRKTLFGIVESLTGGDPGRARKRRRLPATLVEANVGTHLRKMREARQGRWQSARPASAGSVVLCTGLAAERDEFVTEVLVRALLDAGLDARSFTLPLSPDEQPGGDELRDQVTTVFITYPLETSLAAWSSAVRDLRARMPGAVLATVRLPQDSDAIEASVQGDADLVLRSFSEAVAFVQEGVTAKTTD
jgi:predicted PurR-regulated permease PerM